MYKNKKKQNSPVVHNIHSVLGIMPLFFLHIEQNANPIILKTEQYKQAIAGPSKIRVEKAPESLKSKKTKGESEKQQNDKKSELADNASKKEEVQFIHLTSGSV